MKFDIIQIYLFQKTDTFFYKVFLQINTKNLRWRVRLIHVAYGFRIKRCIC